MSRGLHTSTATLLFCLQVLTVGQSRRDAALRSKRLRRSDGVPLAEWPSDAGQPADSAAAVSDAIAALAAERDVDSAPHLAALQTVRRLLSQGVHLLWRACWSCKMLFPRSVGDADYWRSSPRLLICTGEEPPFDAAVAAGIVPLLVRALQPHR